MHIFTLKLLAWSSCGLGLAWPWGMALACPLVELRGLGLGLGTCGLVNIPAELCTVFMFVLYRILQFNDVFIFYTKSHDGFYRATLCVSAVFAVGWCPSFHPSICLSVRPFVYCIQAAATFSAR